MIEFAKSESKGKCRLSDQTTADKARTRSKAGCDVRDECRPFESVGCAPTCSLTSMLATPTGVAGAVGHLPELLHARARLQHGGCA